MEMNSLSEQENLTFHNECEIEMRKNDLLEPENEIEEGLRIKELQNLILKRSLEKTNPDLNQNLSNI